MISLNREAGAKLARSRRCIVEQLSIMSLGNWEGERSDETESEELPSLVFFCSLRVMGIGIWYNYTFFLPFCLLAKRLFYFGSYFLICVIRIHGEKMKDNIWEKR